MSRVAQTLASLSLEQRQALEALLRKKHAKEVPPERGGETAIVPREERHRFPLSFAQERLWFLHQLEPNSAFYNIPLALRLREPLRQEVLAWSFGQVLRRHEALRARFANEDGGPVQTIDPVVDAVLPRVDLLRLAPAPRESEARRLAESEARRPFDLARGPLIRVTLLDCGARDHRLLVTLHHIVADGWSMQVLLREVLTLYRCREQGVAPSLPELSIQYADFADWQRRRLREAGLASHLAYWRERLAGAPVLALPLDRPRATVQRFRGALVPFALPPDLTAKIRSAGRQADASPFMVLLAMFQALLSRHAGQDDIIVGTPAANRDRPELESLIGFFVNPLVLRGDLTGDPDFDRLLGRVREAVLEAWNHQELPFERMVQELRPERSPGHNPLFQVMLALQATPFAALDPDGPRQDSLGLDGGTAKFDLTLELVDDAPALPGFAEYDSDLFDRTTILRLVQHLEVLGSALVTSPRRPLSSLAVLTGPELEQVRGQWNDTQARPSAEGCFHRVFESQVEEAPAAVAVRRGSATLTYAELNARANQLVHYLRTLGVEREARVGLLLERSLEMIVAMLGVLKSGGAYLPLDPALPAERLAYMVRDSGARWVLASARSSGTAALPGVRVIGLDTAWPEIARQDDANPEGGALPQNLAYLIYTSGSTGPPKAVMVEHRGVPNLVAAQARAFDVRPGDRLLQFASFSFDASVSEIGVALGAGATLVLMEPEEHLPGPDLIALLRQQGITHLTLPPSILAALPPEEPLPELRCVVVAGEACPGELARRWARGRRLLNAYGPTEATVCATMGRLRMEGERVAIGRPIANSVLHLLDGAGRPVPIGVVGEIYIGGIGLARGYLGRAALTAERWVPAPSAATPDEYGARLFRTGDLARYLPDGAVEYLGRIDQQVKIRGFRVELGEIEEALAAQPSVREAVVIAREGRAGSPDLVAYLVVDPVSPPMSTPMALRAALRERLPEPMVPSRFEVLEEMPRTSSGKADRRALAGLEPGSWRAEVTAMAPRTDLERAIAETWRAVLQLERVGVDDNFFDLGGHSLLLVQVHSRLRASLGRDLTVVDLFRYPTIRALASHLAPPPADGDAGLASGRSPGLAVALSRATGEIAITGMAGRFPGARNLAELWQNLAGGVESIAFFSDEELIAAGVEAAHFKRPGYVKAGGVLEDVDRFDASFFGLTPGEAASMDPQHRVFLECAWEALESAGYDGDRYPGRIGVYAGVSMNTYQFNLLSNPEFVRAGNAFQAMIGNDKDFLPTRVSYKLNLRGPSLAVQTACSSSLVAVHMACRSLLQGECDMALAGGVSIVFPQKLGYFYEEGGIQSPDGHCRAFDAGARGTVKGNGSGVVVLKRLEEALCDGDEIHGVIKGSAVNNDGSRKVGYTAPSVDGQAAVIAEALAAAGVAPESVTYVEAHGTGTILGDPIEVAALTKAFRAGTARESFCALGSVKTNIGHLDAAAGVAGLIKTVLCLKHRRLVPGLHFEEPNPAIEFARSPFYVNTALLDWAPGDGPRRAGVSSFGIGGTNAHVVVEEAPPRPAPAPEAAESSRGKSRLLLLSAKTASALDLSTARLAAHLRSHPEVDLGDVSYTLMVGRRAFENRRILVCQDLGEAVAGLSGESLRAVSGTSQSRDRSVAFLFPGQGTQKLSMGQDLYRQEASFRGDVDRCAELLQPSLGVDLRRLLDPAPGDRAVSADLDSTCFAQPALFVVEYALAQLWMKWGVQPQAMLGHSIGEYVAACLAGVFSLPEALALVASRGRLMQGLPGGAMLAVVLPEREIAPLLGGDLSLAAVNAPESCVISGLPDSIAALERQLVAGGRVVRSLQTSHAFHSAMMEPILDAFAAEVRRARPQPPRIPFLSNVTGTWIRDEEATSPEYWALHLRRTVRFSAGLQELLRDPDRVLLEVGPRRSLAALARRHPEAAGRIILSSALAGGDGKEAAPLLETLGRLWLAGIRVDGAGLFAEEKRRRLELPTYPFARQRHWIEPGGRKAAASAEAVRRSSEIAEWFYLPSWKRSLPPIPNEREGSQPACLLFVDRLGLGAQLGERLARRGWRVIRVREAGGFARSGDEITLDPLRREDYDALLSDLAAAGGLPGAIFHLWSLAAEPAAEPLGETLPPRAPDAGFLNLLFLLQALGRCQLPGPVRLAVVSSDLQPVTGEEVLCPERATLLGLCETVELESAHLRCKSIDLLAWERGAREPEFVEQLLDELVSGAPDRFVAYRRGYRWVRTFEPVRLEPRPGAPLRLRHRGVYLITGGLGGIGLELAESLGRTQQARLALLGRSAFPARGDWDAWISSHGEGDEICQKIRRLQSLEEGGAQVLVLSADVADPSAMRVAVDRIRERFGEIHGVIHAAGVPGGGLIQRQTPDSVAAVLAPKVAGTRVIESMFRQGGLDFLLLCSSLMSMAGRPGRAEYCAASVFLDTFAHASRGGIFTLSVNWDTWREAGMAAAAAEGMGLGSALGGIASADGVEVFRRVLGCNVPQIAVSTEDLPARIERDRVVASAAVPMAEPSSSLPGHLRPDLPVPFVAPRNEAEAVLQEIWQYLLGIAPVGIDDDFILLGGDSVLSIQVAARARQVGLLLSLDQVFEQTTIAKLAAVAGRAAGGPAAQEVVTGPVPLTPIQHWFFAEDRPSPQHWNQSILLAGRTGFDPAVLRSAVRHLLIHHDALRLRFTRQGDGWRQDNVAPEAPPPLTCFDLSGLRAAERTAAIETAAADAQASLDLAAGPVVRCALFRCGPADSDRLLIVAHHLTVDAVSWRILLDDLQALYGRLARGEAVSLPAKTTSYQEWARGLERYAGSAALAEERAYWLDEARRQAPRLPVDVAGAANSMGSARSMTARLSVDDTEALLREIPPLHHLEVGDFLLTALVRASARWTGVPLLAVEMEGHGREGIEARMDLSRTVGWFTSIFPVLLDLRGVAPDGLAALKAVKDQLRAVPRRGIGYGVLRYLGAAEIRERLRVLPGPEVNFLYLGQLDQVLPDTGLFALAPESKGPEQSPSGPRGSLLNVAAAVVGGRLEVTWTYSESHHHRATIEALRDDFQAELHTLITTCRAVEGSVYTPSDFARIALSAEELDDLVANLEMPEP